ncbi:MAG: diaminobutyrate--2-oxoglutarate transaminase [Candidatus Binatia bacterium]
MQTFERLESEVRSYCRSFPAIFTHAAGSTVSDKNGKEYLDFFSGAGALNYGHNNPRLKQRLLAYIEADGVTHSLDMATSAKEHLLEQFSSIILEPRGLDYKVQFPGPTGTNAVESALKLARKITGRHKILAFTNAFHGMTLGSLAVSGNAFKRDGAGIVLTHTVCMPYDNYFGDQVDTIEYIDQLLQDTGSGIDVPAAVIVETIQAEGGINVARFEWLQRLEALCRKYEMLLIVDDIQVGCGRTGPFFSFEPASISPDFICLSKSISGYGLPMALTLIKREYDLWQPGEHNGTFRGHNLAFVTAAAALSYWKTDELQLAVHRKGEKTQEFLQTLAAQHPEVGATVRGRGLIQGMECGQTGLAELLSRAAFRRGLIAETSGADSQVFKLLPPLTITDADLEAGFRLIDESFAEVLHGRRQFSVPAGANIPVGNPPHSQT